MNSQTGTTSVGQANPERRQRLSESELRPAHRPDPYFAQTGGGTAPAARNSQQSLLAIHADLEEKVSKLSVALDDLQMVLAPLLCPETPQNECLETCLETCGSPLGAGLMSLGRRLDVQTGKVNTLNARIAI